MVLYDSLQQGPFLLAGPCVIESEALLDQVAQHLHRLQQLYPNWTIVFKASFDKANRTAVNSFRGPGLEQGLAMLQRIKERYGLPLVTDIHEPHQAAAAAQVVDLIQIPAFLCRQTDLLLAAGDTGRIVTIKKAQFLSGKDMQYVAEKVASTGNRQILLTERGTAFGYNNLVVDYTGVLDMMALGYPVVMDATHSVQKPGGAKGKSGGNRAYAPYLAKAAAAVGVRGFFVETHPRPDEARSDGPNMLTLEALEQLLYELNALATLDFFQPS